MQLTETSCLTAQQKQSLLELWNQEYPAQLGYVSLADFEKYLDTLTTAKHRLLIAQPNKIAGWAFTFIREQQTWFAIILDSSWHQQGIGTQLINTLKLDSTELHGWVVDHAHYLKPDGLSYPSPLPFYLKNQFTICKDVRLETAQLSAVKIHWTKTTRP